MNEKTETIPKLPVARLIQHKSRNYDIGKFFGSIRPGILFGLLVLGNLIIVAVGAFIGYQRFLKGNTVSEAPLETATGAVLSLAAFMLAFTFSTVWSRFAARNGLVILHAKAISVCWLRTSIITEKQKMQIRKMLLEYTHHLMELQTTPELQKSLDRIENLHLEIWAQAGSLVHEDIDSEMRSLFVASVNDLISIAAERKIRTLFLRIPDAIWGSLLFLSIIGMFASGYQAGIGGMGRLFHLPLLPFAFGIVIVLIADLNSPYSQRHFRVTQKPLIEVLLMMEKEIP
jgi:hypothetical protein